jgi:hypothetical protein
MGRALYSLAVTIRDNRAEIERLRGEVERLREALLLGHVDDTLRVLNEALESDR